MISPSNQNCENLPRCVDQSLPIDFAYWDGNMLQVVSGIGRDAGSLCRSNNPDRLRQVEDIERFRLRIGAVLSRVMGKIEIVRLLLERSAPKEHRIPDGNTAFSWARALGINQRSRFLASSH